MVRILFTQSLLLIFCLHLHAQNELRGTISDEYGAIPGATIQVIETGAGAISDAEGFYLIKDLTEGSYTVEVRSQGYKYIKKSILIPTSNELNFAMEESTLTMDEVVITGTMQPTFVSASPVKVDVITSNFIETYAPAAATSIVESISLINGVQEVVACGVCFTNSISINGLPGPYTAVLMDGSPIYGNLASVYGLNGIPSMIIDRFEVIKGPSSTLYGSEAVAGVINIITKDPGTHPRLSLDIMGTTHMETFGNFSFAPSIGKSNGFIGLNYAYIGDFDDVNNDGLGDMINLDRISLFSKWNIHRPSGRRFTMTGKYFYEDRRNGVEAFLRDKNYRTLRGNDQIYGESIYTNRLELFGTYEFLDNLRMDYSASTHDQNSFYGADFYQAKQNIFFSNLIWDRSLNSHSLTLGLTNRYQMYDDNTVATETATGNSPDAQYIPGVFAQDEWKISDKVTTLTGLRLDHYENHGLIFAPRFNVKYKPGQWTTLRTNFGTGFRIVNLFTEDHAFVTGQREVVIAEELRPEESLNVSLNANHIYTIGNSQGMIDIDAFYTYFSNKINPDYETDGQIIYANTNGFAESQGIGISIQQELMAPLTFNAGFNIQQVTETEEGETRSIEFAPTWTGVLTANYQFRKSKTVVAYTARFTGPMALPEVFDLDLSGDPFPNPRPTKSDPFAIHNIQVTKELKDGFSLYFGAQNIFDYIQPWSPLTGINDPNAPVGFSDQFDTAYAYAPIHGREFYLGLNWSLGR